LNSAVGRYTLRDWQSSEISRRGLRGDHVRAGGRQSTHEPGRERSISPRLGEAEAHGRSRSGIVRLGPKPGSGSARNRSPQPRAKGIVSDRQAVGSMEPVFDCGIIAGASCGEVDSVESVDHVRRPMP